MPTSPKASAFAVPVGPFPADYWSDGYRHDRGFLEELRRLAASAPAAMTALYAQRARATGDADERRILASRAVTELMQGIETFFVLLLAVRQRSSRSIFDTFVDHKTTETRDLMNHVPGASIDDVRVLLGLPESETQTPEFGRVHGAVTRLAAQLTIKDGSLRTFHNKVKHGAVLVSRVGQEDRETEMVFAIARNPQPVRPDAPWDAVGVPTTDDFCTVTAALGGFTADALRALIDWTAQRLDERAL
jgi:hypothetical protein